MRRPRQDSGITRLDLALYFACGMAVLFALAMASDHALQVLSPEPMERPYGR